MDELSIFEITLDEETFQVTVEGAQDGEDGREIEIQNNGTHIQWRYAGDVSWTNLVALTALKGDVGDTGIVPRGVYDSLESYAVNDAVTHNGSFYICVQASEGNSPNNVQYWTKYVSEGDVAGFLADRPVYSDNSAAITGGLGVGDTYIRTDGLVAIVV